ncbi:MAG: hemerythrin family protein [Synergistaceae bacterium]|nr:hemerythrin family protein [Synergistaceae bacterium]
MLWNKSLEIGIPAIDDQHKELFRQVDILLDNSKQDRVSQTLKFLGAYVKKHFSDEQMLHIKAKYPKAETHRKMHTDFVGAYVKMEKEYESDSANKLQVLLRINKTVVDWLKHHIMVQDKDFAAYYKSSNEKK